MADDTTTTWLKKNNEIHPLKRSLKTSMRLQVNNSEMDASIISNLGKPTDQQIFIPRMMQRQSIRMMKLRTSKLLPEVTTAKTLSKPKPSNINTGGVKVQTKGVAPAFPKKSCLPVRRNQASSSNKKSDPKIFVRPNFLLGSIRKNTARRELIEKMVKLDEESQKGSIIKTSETKNSPHSTADSSVLRSILKKRRNSLRRASQILNEKKSRGAKKVLFEDFQKDSCENKENEKNSSINDDSNNDFAVLEEPTVFLNFPISNNFESTPDDKKTVKSEIILSNSEDLKNVLEIFSAYQEKVKYLKSAENSLSKWLESAIRSSQKLKDEFDSYKKISEEMHSELARLDEEVNEKLSRILGSVKRTKDFESLNDSRKKNKIRLSDKSINIRKNSFKKPGPAIKKGLWISSEENYTLVEKENVFSNL